VSIDRTSEGSIGVGATFRLVARDAHGREHAVQMTIVEHCPPTNLVFHETGGMPGYERTTYVLQSVSGGTKVRMSHMGIDMGISGPIAAMFTQAARDNARDAFAWVKRHLESGAPTARH
jgi:hypothetical protein